LRSNKRPSLVCARRQAFVLDLTPIPKGRFAALAHHPFGSVFLGRTREKARAVTKDKYGKEEMKDR